MPKPWENYAKKKPWETFRDQKSPEPQLEQTEEEPGMMTKGLGYLLRGLDFAGGATRAGAMNLAPLAALMQNPNNPKAMAALATGQMTKEGDFERIMSGQAPSTSEYLERMGYDPESGTVKTAGFVGDVALDPTTYATGGGNLVQKAMNLPNKIRS